MYKNLAIEMAEDVHKEDCFFAGRVHRGFRQSNFENQCFVMEER